MEKIDCEGRCRFVESVINKIEKDQFVKIDPRFILGRIKIEGAWRRRINMEDNKICKVTRITCQDLTIKIVEVCGSGSHMREDDDISIQKEENSTEDRGATG